MIPMEKLFDSKRKISGASGLRTNAGSAKDLETLS
jgi:hypothetical protein